MDPRREPGIHFLGVYVDKIRFTDLASGADRPSSLHYTGWIERRTIEAPAGVEIVLHFAIRDSETEIAGFGLELSVTGEFSPDSTSENMDLAEFAEENGPALLMPFVREMVANITARSRHGLVLLPPINVKALAAQQAASQPR